MGGQAARKKIFCEMRARYGRNVPFAEYKAGLVFALTTLQANCYSFLCATVAMSFRPTEYVNLHALREACSQPVDERTVRKDRVVRNALQLFRSGKMTHVVLAYLKCPTRPVRHVPVYEDETVADAPRTPLTPQQLAFERYVLPSYLENDERRGSSIAAMAVHGMVWDDVEVVGESEGRDLEGLTRIPVHSMKN